MELEPLWDHLRRFFFRHWFWQRSRERKEKVQQEGKKEEERDDFGFLFLFSFFVFVFSLRQTNSKFSTTTQIDALLEPCCCQRDARVISCVCSKVQTSCGLPGSFATPLF